MIFGTHGTVDIPFFYSFSFLFSTVYHVIHKKTVYQNTSVYIYIYIYIYIYTYLYTVDLKDKTGYKEQLISMLAIEPLCISVENENLGCNMNYNKTHFLNGPNGHSCSSTE